MIEKFMQDVAALGLGAAPDADQLAKVGSLMRELARTADWRALQLRQAGGDEELLYPLHTVPAQPALYLVSDGPGVASAPHEHGTWAVIVGLSGNELNVLYERDPDTAATVRPRSRRDIRAYDVLYLPADAIHATCAMDDVPTFHLHLYGKPLNELPPYAVRCHQT